MFDEEVIECFQRLSWHYHTNQPHKFGKRITVRHLAYTFGINKDAAGQLDDLLRVLCVLDGRTEPDYRQRCYVQLSAAFEEQRSWPKNYDNHYFSVRLFRNGNGHVGFKHLDLIDRMNGIITRLHPNVLPALR